MVLWELLKVVTYTKLEDHIEITLYDEKAYEHDNVEECYNVEVTPHNIVKYAGYRVIDIAVDGGLLQIMIER